MKAANLASGTLYPILARLADRGWLEKQWEMDPEASGPPRRVYTLTSLGRAQIEGPSARTEMKLNTQSARTVQ